MNQLAQARLLADAIVQDPRIAVAIMVRIKAATSGSVAN